MDLSELCTGAMNDSLDTPLPAATQAAAAPSDASAKAAPIVQELLGEPIQVWGLPLAPLTMERTLEVLDGMIAARKPGWFITANLNFAMLHDSNAELREATRSATFVTADGMPMVWWAKLRGRPLPGRVTGSDLIFRLSQHAAEQGHRLFFLGGAPGVAEEAKRNLQDRFPGLQVVGTASPPFRDLTEEEHSALIRQIHHAKPDVLLVAFGQPKGEIWLDKHLQELNVPVCAQVGASLDFAAGRVPRAPKLVQKLGVEWAYRIWREPSRMAPRYWQNFRFLLKAVLYLR